MMMNGSLTLSLTTMRRDYEASKNPQEEAFSDEQEHIQYGGGVAASPLLEFDLQPVGARRNWRNVLNKQWFKATLRQR